MIESDDSDGHEKVKLFDNKPRDFTKWSRRSETSYSFLDRSSLPEFERVRSMLERWVGRLPKTHQQETVAKMRHKAQGSAKEQFQFNAAFFELFLHEFLLSTGGEVQVEPIIDRLTPDFRVTEELAGGSQLTYVVEATDIDLERGTKLERDWNELWVIDSLNEIFSPDYCLWIHMDGRLESLPRKKHLKRPFENLLKEAQYEEALLIQQSEEGGLKDLPNASFGHGGWNLVGHLIPVSPEYRGQTEAFVANGPMKVDNIDDIGKTKDRLYQKAKRYKNVDDLIIALRCDNSNTRFREVLFGSQQLTFYVHNDPTETTPLPDPQNSRRRDGFWFNSVGPQNLNVIGVVAFYNVHPWSIEDVKAMFYSNPYVDKPMPDWTRSITHAEYSDGEVSMVEGMPPYEFLGDYKVIGDPFG